MTQQSGGGFGDQRTRAPEAVARDVREGKVSAAAAREIHGWRPRTR